MEQENNQNHLGSSAMRRLKSRRNISSKDLADSVVTLLVSVLVLVFFVLSPLLAFSSGSASTFPFFREFIIFVGLPAFLYFLIRWKQS